VAVLLNTAATAMVDTANTRLIAFMISLALCSAAVLAAR
jgi:hypothetical protein